jgi:colanic acid biosynthesis glycosyl transferase WcaI
LNIDMQMPMKILILTQWYPPEPGLLQQELAQTLMAHGHHVTVLTGFPNFPSGKLYPGYRVQLLQRETIAGVTVVRVPLYPEHSRSGIKRALNYLSFAISAAILGWFYISRPDVMFIYHPPLTVSIPAYILSRLWRIPFVYQIQDMWPETLGATGMLNNTAILASIGHFAKWVYKKATAICVISPGFHANLIKKGVPADKIHVISNWVDSDAYYVADSDHNLAESLRLSNKFNVMFAGIIGAAQGLEVVLDAARLLRDDKNIQFVLVGDGIALSGLQNAASDQNLNNVLFLGRYPQESMPGLYALADVLLVHLKNDPLFRITIPHKTLTYLASGKPILAAIAGDTANVVTKAGAGISCPASDPEALAEAVRKLYHLEKSELQHMGWNGRQAAHDIYSREHLVSEIETVLKQAIESSHNASYNA